MQQRLWTEEAGRPERQNIKQCKINSRVLITGGLSVCPSGPVGGTWVVPGVGCWVTLGWVGGKGQTGVSQHGLYTSRTM